VEVYDLVKVIKNDMSLIICKNASKDSLFFSGIGIVIKTYAPDGWNVPHLWFDVMFPSGIYSAREDSIELINV